MARGGFREGAGRVQQAPPINPLLSILSASQGLPRLTPRKHSKHSLMLPETVAQMRLESLRLMPYLTEPMASPQFKKKKRLWIYRQWLFS